MASKTVVIFTTGPAGTGKTYLRCPVFLLKDFLPSGRTFHWSNFPLGPVPVDHVEPPAYDGETFAERVAVEAARRHGGQSADYLDRIRVIPPAEIERWRLGESGPWEFFKDVNLAGCHIAIDEIHNFCGRATHHAVRRKYQAWLGEIRHRGATIEFLSQSPNKVGKEIGWEAGEQIQLRSSESLRDPWFRIPMGDWYELRAKFFTFEYHSQIHVQYLAQGFMGRWKVRHLEKVSLDPQYFRYFDSFSAPHAGGSSGKTAQHEWQRRSVPGLLWWFVSRHCVALGSRFAVLGVLVFLIFGGGGPLMRLWLSMMPSPGSSPSASVVHASVVASIDPGASPSVALPGDDRLPVPESTFVQARLDALRGEVAEQARRVRVLRERLLEASSVVLLTRDRVVFRGGFEYRIGQYIDYGPFKGRTIQGIDYDRRCVELSGGVVLRMGFDVPAGGGLPEPADVGVVGSDFQGQIRGSHGGAASGQRVGGGIPASDHQHSGHAADLLLPLDQRSDRSLGDSGAGVGQSPGHR